MISGFATYIAIPFILGYAWNSWKDYRTGKVNALAFAVMDGMLYAGYHFVPSANVLVAILLTLAYAFLWFLGSRKVGIPSFGLGDISMLLPFSLLCYLFLDFWLFVTAHLLLFLVGGIWLKFSGSRAFCPPVFACILAVLGYLVFFSA